MNRHRRPAGHHPPEAVAAAIGRPAHRLLLLDRRPLTFLMIAGGYETFEVLDLNTGRTRQVTLDIATGATADPDRLRAQDQRLAAAIPPVLAATLKSLLLRHPELERLDVTVTDGHGNSYRRSLPPADIIALATSGTATRIELASEPEIPD